jgi:hypothetical protein
VNVVVVELFPRVVNGVPAVQDGSAVVTKNEGT